MGILFMHAHLTIAQGARVRPAPPITSDGSARSIVLEPSRPISSATLQNDTLFSSNLDASAPEEPREEESDIVFSAFQRDSSLIYSQSVPPDCSPDIGQPFDVTWEQNANMGDQAVPLDHAVATNTVGWTICATNKKISYYKNGEFKLLQDLGHLLSNVLPEPCDPKLLVDPGNQRFIIFAQRNSGQQQIPEIAVGFSRSTDPLDGWTFYKLTGNPENIRDRWFDYPGMGISKDGLYVSGNIFKPPPPGQREPRFVESVIYQIDKNAGFAGNDVACRVWLDITPKPTVLTPISAVDSPLTGPGITSSAQGLSMAPTCWTSMR